MIYNLPTKVNVGGKDYDVRTDYRVILEIFEAMNDEELSDTDRSLCCLVMFYIDFDKIKDVNYQEAIEKMLWFINCGEEDDNTKRPKIMDWEQDYNIIIPPINKIAGFEVRAVEYLHWWTFMGLYQEIGDCTFSQVVGIRSKQARGKKLDKSEQEFLKRNRKMVELKNKYTQADKDLLKSVGIS